MASETRATKLELSRFFGMTGLRVCSNYFSRAKEDRASRFFQRVQSGRVEGTARKPSGKRRAKSNFSTKREALPGRDEACAHLEPGDTPTKSADPA